MTSSTLATTLWNLHTRGIQIKLENGVLIAQPIAGLTEDERRTISANEPDLIRLMVEQGVTTMSQLIWQSMLRLRNADGTWPAVVGEYANLEIERLETERAEALEYALEVARQNQRLCEILQKDMPGLRVWGQA